MTREYIIFNPQTGTNERTADKNEAIKILARVAMDFYSKHTHYRPYAMAKKLDDGMTEEISFPYGDELITYDTVLNYVIDTIEADNKLK